MEACLKNSENNLEPCNYQEEAHFAFSSNNWTFKKSSLSEDTCLLYLDYSIKRKKNDLLSHTRKISLCQQIKNRNLLYASLKDLFSILGGSGLKLKIKLTKSSKGILKESHYRQLIVDIKNTH